MRKVAFASLICVSLATSGAAHAEDCSDPQSQMQMNICAGEAYKRADAELNTTYKKVRKQLKTWDTDSPVSISKSLLKAQRAWLKFRDAHCQSVADQYHGGSIQPMVAASCFEQLTKERTKQLLTFLEGG